MTDNEAARWRQRINSTIHTYLFSIGPDRPVHYYDTPLASTTRERGHLLEAAACAFRFSPVWTARQVQVFRDLASYALSLDGTEQRGFLCACQDLYILPQYVQSIHSGLTDEQVAALFFRPFGNDAASSLS